MAKPNITLAPEVARVAVPLIREHFDHLRDARILYVFTDKPGTRGGRAVKD